MKHIYLITVFFLSTAFINAHSSSVINTQQGMIAVFNPKSFPKNIIVSNVEELYKAVNGPNDDGTGNEGVHIFLKPVEYDLSASTVKDGRTVNRRNMGRLEFQKDMKITGHFENNENNKHDPAKAPASIINGSHLPKESFQINAGDNEPKRTGFIRMGKGDNMLSHVKVIGNTLVNPDGSASALSSIDTDLCDVQTASGNGSICSNTIVRIEHNLIMNGQTGINIRNGGVRASNRKLTAFIVDNDIKDMKTAAGQGITIQNSVNVTGSSINADLRDNILHFSNAGLRIMNQHANSGKIIVSSHNDSFEDNAGNGILIYGGMDINSSTVTNTANENTLRFDGHDSHIRNNKGNSPLYADAGGVFVCGGFTAKVAGRTSNNIVELNLFKPEFSNNTDKSNKKVDVSAYGARSDASGAAGVSNIVNILIQGAPGCIVNTIKNDHPASPETNAVNKKIQ